MLEISAIRVWKEAGYPLPIHYSAAVAEQIRQFAVEGLLALPRVGLGVGGLLIGRKEGRSVTLVGSAPIPCSHATGPSFLLTEEEAEIAKIRAREFSVVGCYLSKTGKVALLNDLSASDLNFYRTFCPEPWQILLKIKPSTVEETLVTLYFRGSSGAIIRGTERPLTGDLSGDLAEDLPVEADPVPDPGPPVVVENRPELAYSEPQLVDNPRVSGRTVGILVIAALLIGGAIELLLQLR